jgi:hypothetical protein
MSPPTQKARATNSGDRYSDTAYASFGQGHRPSQLLYHSRPLRASPAVGSPKRVGSRLAVTRAPQRQPHGICRPGGRPRSPTWVYSLCATPGKDPFGNYGGAANRTCRHPRFDFEFLLRTTVSGPTRALSEQH